jgi:hypothetical protein
MIAQTSQPASLPRRGTRLQFSLRTLLLLATLSCLILAALYAENQSRLAKRNALAKRLETLNVEIKQRMGAFLDNAREAGRLGYKESKDQIALRLQKSAGLKSQERELKQLQNTSNEISVQLESIDLEGPTWFHRIQALLTASDD